MSLCAGLLPFCHAAVASPRLPSPGHLQRLCGKWLGGLASQLVVVSVWVNKRTDDLSQPPSRCYIALSSVSDGGHSERELRVAARGPLAGHLAGLLAGQRLRHLHRLSSERQGQGHHGGRVHLPHATHLARTAASVVRVLPQPRGSPGGEAL